MIEIKNLSKTFNSENIEKVALKNINLEIKDKEIFGIIGLSGAGKSTLVRTINMLESPTSGDVVIDGIIINKLKKKELLEYRKNIGMIFQNYNLMEQKTILKNVCLPFELLKKDKKIKKKEIIEKAKELLDLVGLKGRYNSYPVTLSGGEKQRVAIARAIALNPKYLLCDEATSALDPQNTLLILDLLKEINRKFGTTIIVITHEMKVIEEICDRVAVIDNSEIAEIGEVKEVFHNPKTKITHDLLVKSDISIANTIGGKRIRVTFDGVSTSEPLISKMVLETKLPVNIMFADTKIIQDALYGHMIFELPNNKTDENIILEWLKNNNISYKEEL